MVWKTLYGELAKTCANSSNLLNSKEKITYIRINLKGELTRSDINYVTRKLKVKTMDP